MKSWLVVALGVFVVLGCQAAGQTLADTDDVGKAVADKGGFLYEITPNTEGAAPFYLFGVIHYDKYFAPQETHLMIKPSVVRSEQRLTPCLQIQIIDLLSPGFAGNEIIGA